MAKTQKELNALKEEVEAVSRKLAELTEEELELVGGGSFLSEDYPRGECGWCPNCKALVHVCAGPNIEGLDYLVCDVCGTLIHSGGF